jgi:hypothetical protein
MLNTRHKQQGATAIGTLLIFAMIAIFVYIGLKLFPIYYESFKVSSALKSLKSEVGIKDKPQHEIIRLITNRLQIDDVEHVTNQDITVDRAGRELKVYIDYQVQTNLIGNIDLLISFDKQVEVTM